VYYQIGVMCSSVTQFPVILLNDYLSWPDDVIRPRPLSRVVNESSMDGVEYFGGTGYVFRTESTGQENEFELIPTIKIETRHPAEGPFGN